MTTLKYFLSSTLAILLLMSCNSEKPSEPSEEEAHAHEASSREIHLTEQQVAARDIKIDSLPLRNFSEFISVNGQLQVPPQHEASVTAMIGANVKEIKVIEGDPVKKGQVLATIQHPDLIRIQTSYLEHWNNMQFLEKELQRQQKLYDEEVGSGKELQRIQAEYQILKAQVNGYEEQLKLLGIVPVQIRNGDVYSQVGVVSPIDGFVRKVQIKTGQFVQPETEMFDVVNVSHLHADFLVFERDAHLVKEGQRVRFQIESMAGTELDAVVFSVGKSFESEPKAVHIHAEIEQKKDLLIPGMYIRGQILLGEEMRHALPEAALVRTDSGHIIFTASLHRHGEGNEWAFEPVEVTPGTTNNGWTAIELRKDLKQGQQVVWSNAYYVNAEMNKHSGGEHRH